MTHFIKLAMAALILAVGLVNFGYAEPIPSPPKPDAAAPVDEVRLGDMLEGMGLEITRGTYTSGATYFETKMATTEYTYPVRIGFSPNKRVIWLSVSLGDLPSNTPAERLRALLEAVNSKTGKLQFRLVGDQVKADQPIDNFAVTPIRLRRELTDLTNALQTTFKVWDAKKWETPVDKP